MKRAILKGLLALGSCVSLMLVSCSEEPDRPERTQDDTPQETTMAVEEPGKPPQGVKSYDVGPANVHTEVSVDYAQSPPVGGEHNPIWQNCGFYEEPVRNENAVHSLEHGAVWITFLPELPQDEIERVRDLAQGDSYVLASPYQDQSSPIVASAWGKQLTLQSAEDPSLGQFLQAYVSGPQAPEPEAPCTGGVGQPD